MGKMEKLTRAFVDAGYVAAVIEKNGKCVIKYLTEPEKKKSEKFGSYQYVVEIQAPEILVLNRDADGKPTEYGNLTGKKIKMLWTMNTRSSDWLGDKYGDTADFVGKEEELIAVQQGDKKAVYPSEMFEDDDELDEQDESP